MLLATLLLFSKLKFSVRAAKGEGFSVVCRLGFLKIFETDSTESAEKKHKEKESAAPKEKKEPFFKGKIKSYDDVLECLHSIKTLLIRFKRLIKRVVVKDTVVDLVVVGNDSADTAIKYGAVCSAVYPIVTLLSDCLTFKPEKINVSAGFTEKEMTFSMKSLLSVRIIYLLIFAVSAVKEFINLKRSLEKNERTQH